MSINLQPVTPPNILYHGTAVKNVASILSDGIQKMNRSYIHLSRDYETAHKVGVRHGKPFIFIVRASEMSGAGYLFYVSDNGVYLTDFVPASFVEAIAVI
jgi:putative RNA 2'-phosphotransferase